VLADHPDERVLIPDLMTSLGLKFTQVQGVLSSLTKRMKPHGASKPPFMVENTDDTTAYTMRRDMAIIVIRLAQGEGA
jgi:hypothetical protein